MEKLKALFEKAKIKYVISVDDCYSVYEPTRDDLKTFFSKSKEIAVKFCNEIGISHFEDTVSELDEDYQDYCESFFDTLTPEQVTVFQTNYYTDYEKEKNSLETFFEALKESGTIIDFKKVPSIKEANEIYDNIDDLCETSPDQRLLWMVDKDFAKNTGNADSGIKLITNFIANKRPNHLYALTSAQIGDIDNRKFREILNNDNPESSLNLLACVIHKHNIIEKAYGNLFEQMYLGFRENYSGEIINCLKNNLLEASKGAGEKTDLLSDEAINNVIFLGSKNEGISPIDTLQRLMMIILRDDLIIKLSDSYDTIAKLVYDYTELCSWCSIDKRDPNDFERIVNIRKSECYYQNINKMYSPVSYGDIFEINNKPYILISQSCNLVIRADGHRNAQCATLAEIEYGQSPSESNYELSYFDTKKKVHISFNKTINVDFSVLDLCCLNDTGDLKLSNDFELSNVDYRYTSGMALALKKVISENQKMIMGYERLSSFKNELTIEQILSEARSIYKDNSTELIASFDNGISYNGRRVCRLSSDITDDVSKRYFEYHSRKGLGFDFAEKYTIHEYQVILNYDFSKINVDESQLMYDRKFNYYYVGEKDKDDMKARIKEEFKGFYRNKFFEDKEIELKEEPKIDTKNRSITVSPSNIPVIINDDLLNNVLSNKGDEITLKIPITHFCAGEIKNRAQKTYPDDTNNSTLVVSNKCLSFTFKNDLVFENSDIIDGKIVFRFEVDKHIKLTITKENK